MGGLSHNVLSVINMKPLASLGEGLIQGGELGLQVLGVGVQFASQVFSVGGQPLLDQLASLGQLGLEVNNQGGHTRLEVQQVLVHLLLELLGIGAQLGLQLLHTLLQTALQLLTLLEQGGLQGLGVQRPSIGGHRILELLHLLQNLGSHVLCVGLQFPLKGSEVLPQTLLQHFSLLGNIVPKGICQ